MLGDIFPELALMAATGCVAAAMAQRIHRSISEAFRESLSIGERWNGPDKGLISCWEVGRRLTKCAPELAASAKRGELPELGWKGGV